MLIYFICQQYDENIRCLSVNGHPSFSVAVISYTECVTIALLHAIARHTSHRNGRLQNLDERPFLRARSTQILPVTRFFVVGAIITVHVAMRAYNSSMWSRESISAPICFDIGATLWPC